MIRRMSSTSFSAWHHIRGSFRNVHSIARLVTRILLDSNNIQSITWADIPPQLTVSDFPLQMCGFTRGPLSRTDCEPTVSHSRRDTFLNCLIIGSTVTLEIRFMFCALFVANDEVDLQYALADFGLPFASFRWFLNLAAAYSGSLLTLSMMCLNIFQTAAQEWPARESAWTVLLIKRGQSMALAEVFNGAAEREHPGFIRLWIKMYALYVSSLVASLIGFFMFAVYVSFITFFIIPLNGWPSVLRSTLWTVITWLPGCFIMSHIIITTAEYLSEMLFHTYIAQRVHRKLLHFFHLTSIVSRDKSVIHAVQLWPRSSLVSILNLLDVSRRHLGAVRDMMSVTTFFFQVGPISAGLFWLYFAAYFSVTPVLKAFCTLALCLCLIAVSGISIPALRVRYLFARLNPLIHRILVPGPTSRLSLRVKFRLMAALEYIDQITEEGVLWVGCCYPLVGSAYCYSLLEAGTYFLLLISLIGTPDEQVLQQVKKS